MTGIILSIGDELILGQTVDSNSAWLSQQLAAIGVPVLAHITVADDQPAIEQAIDESVQRCQVLLISGGIGPTPDDLTRQALAGVMKKPLKVDEAWLMHIRKFFRRLGREMPEMNAIQAMIPHGAELIWNHNGTAAGIYARLTSENGEEKAATHVFVMPGVPKEMHSMYRRDVLPRVEGLLAGSGGAVILSRTLHTFGLGESGIAQMLGDLMRRDRNPGVGTTVSQGVVSVRINARFGSRDEAERELAETQRLCREALGNLVYGADDQSLPQVVGQLLKEKGQTVATAESCTGGLLAKYLTDIPGSSAYFNRGWVTYSNEAKIQDLGVPASLIDELGAVSEAVVRSMASEARRRSGADYALAISGIAGPDGGTPQKPVGTVCIALALPTDVVARTFLFPGDREMIRDRSAKMAMTMLRFHLLGKPLPS
jgi:nicotinamide-nucleotide amidase